MAMWDQSSLSSKVVSRIGRVQLNCPRTRSAESDAVRKQNTSWLRDPSLETEAFLSLPPSRSCSTVNGKSMSTSLQGTSSSSGHTASQSGPKKHGAHEPALQLGRISQEQSISIQIRKLAVSLFIDVFELRVDEYLVTQERCRKVPGTARGMILSLSGEIST